MEEPRGGWPFGGRPEELVLVRDGLRGGRRGAVVAGAAGTGRSRLAAEAVRRLPHAWVTGTPEGRSLRFGAFAHLLPGTAADSLSRAVEAMRPARVLVVDDAHLLDEASAALVHHLAAQRRTRLLVTVRSDEAAPEAVAGLWRRHVLPRLDLGPLSAQETGDVLASALGAHVEDLTVRRLHRLSGGNPRLLRELVAAVREDGGLERVGSVWRWRGEVPVTGVLRELVTAMIGDVGEAEREALELVAFAEPLSLPTSPAPAAGAAGPSVAVLERLEARGLLLCDDDLRVRLAHPLLGPVLRAGVGALRARRLARTAGARPAADAETRARPTADGETEARSAAHAETGARPTADGETGAGPSRAPACPGGGRDLSPGPALAAQTARITTLVYAGQIPQITPGVGERLAEDDAGWDEPLMADFCARRAWLARLRGELREAVAWSGEGVRRSPAHRPSLAELACASAHLGDVRAAEDALARCGDDPSARAWVLAARGDLAGARRSALEAAQGRPGPEANLRGAQPGGSGSRAEAAHTGVPRPRAALGGPVAQAAEGPATAGSGDLFALHDVARFGAPDLVAGRLALLADTVRGDLAPVLAEHAAAMADGDAAALDKAARRLADLGLLLHAAEAAGHAAQAHPGGRAAGASLAYAATLARACQGARTPVLVDLATPGLTPRQRQIAGLAAAGLTNREIARLLGLSIRTVANQLCRAYERFGTSDRASLGTLLSLASHNDYCARDIAQ
ncbi:helix-turn-helix transcriptional regulator [Microbispora corallina]